MRSAVFCRRSQLPTWIAIAVSVAPTCFVPEIETCVSPPFGKASRGAIRHRGTRQRTCSAGGAADAVPPSPPAVPRPIPRGADVPPAAPRRADAAQPRLSSMKKKVVVTDRMQRGFGEKYLTDCRAEFPKLAVWRRNGWSRRCAADSTMARDCAARSGHSEALRTRRPRVQKEAAVTCVFW